MHRVTEFDKRLLVWVKRYPNIAAVPKDVTYVLHLYLYICIILDKIFRRDKEKNF